MTTTADAPPAAPAFKPAALPEGRIACASCGAAVSRPLAHVEREIFAAWWTPQGNAMLLAVRASYVPPASQSFELARCPQCRPMRDRAAAYATSGGILAEQAEAALCALAAIGRPLPPYGSDLAALTGRLRVPGRFARWHDQARPGLCSPEPWAHVTEEDRAEIRKGCAGLLAERLAAGRPPERIAPPEGAALRGCLLCGVGHVEVPAVQVARMGGTAEATRAVWQKTSGDFQDQRGMTLRREGHLCPACAAAEVSAGALGPTAIVRALLGYMDASGRQDKARNLREGLLANEIRAMALLPAWCATGLPRPSKTPWQHIPTFELTGSVEGEIYV